MKTFRISPLIAIALATACGGDSSKTADGAKAADSAAAANTPEAYRAQQKAFADSVLNATSNVADVAKRLGKGYAVGSVALRDTVAKLAGSSACFANARKSDPYLTGSATIWVNMSVIGTDVIRVQEASWTSPVGKAVEACLNDSAKAWKLDTKLGKPAAYLVQVVFK